MTLVSIYDVACPYCRAAKHARCMVAHIDRRRPPAVRQYPHESRRTAFRIAVAAEHVRPAG